MKCLVSDDFQRLQVSLPVRGAWIEIAHRLSREYLDTSLPVRGAWIEIIVFRRA